MVQRFRRKELVICILVAASASRDVRVRLLRVVVVKSQTPRAEVRTTVRRGALEAEAPVEVVERRAALRALCGKNLVVYVLACSSCTRLL